MLTSMDFWTVFYHAFKNWKAWSKTISTINHTQFINKLQELEVTFAGEQNKIWPAIFPPVGESGATLDTWQSQTC